MTVSNQKIAMMGSSRAHTIMKKHGIDVLIGTARENIAYVTGLDGVERRGSNCLERMFVVLPRDAKKETVLVIPQGYLLWVLQNEHEPCALRTIGYYNYVLSNQQNLTSEERRLVDLRERTPGNASPMDALLGALSDVGLEEDATIGIDESRMTFGEVEQLHQARPKARLLEAYGVFREIRMVKSAAEIARLRMAAEVNQRAMLEAIDLIHVGVEHREIREKLRNGMIQSGAVVSHDACGFAWRSSYSHVEPSTYRARRGDIFKFDVGCFLDGYAADTARSGVIGKPSREQLRHYTAVHEAQQLGIEKLRPGILASELYEIMQTSLRKNLKNPTFVRTNYGHGIGRDVYDAPTIAAADDTPLEAGMVLNIEAPDHELGFGGLTLEDTVLLRDDGVEYLTNANRDLYVR